MPTNGEVNTRFGLYKNLCCGQQLIVREGNKFPDCKHHPKLTTIWKHVDLEKSAPVLRRRSA